MSEVITSTRPDKLGTFGAKRVACTFDGTIMHEYAKQDITLEIEQTTLRCPRCGWISTFINRKEE